MRKLDWGEAALIGVAGNAPAYSIAVSSAALAAAAGPAAPLAILVCSFVTAGIVIAYARMNAAQPSAGAAYTWAGSVLHPAAGFFAGWCVMLSGVLFMLSALLPAGKATLLAVAPAHADDKAIVFGLAAAWLLAITAIVSRGTALLGRVQSVMTALELGLIALIAAAVVPSADTLDLTGLWHASAPDVWSAGRLANGLVIAIFMFWGWDVVFNLAEETAQPGRSGARAGFLALALLTAIFVFFAALVAARLSPDELQAAGGNALFALGDMLLPKPLGYLVVLAFLLSAIGGIEASIVSFSRTILANARDGRLPALLGRLHRDTQAPAAATVVGSAVVLALLVASAAFQTVEEAITASINATGIVVAAYYGLAAIACAVFFRRRPEKGLGSFVLYVVWPLTSAAIFFSAALITLIDLDALALSALTLGMVLGLVVLLTRPPAAA